MRRMWSCVSMPRSVFSWNNSYHTGLKSCQNVYVLPTKLKISAPTNVFSSRGTRFDQVSFSSSEAYDPYKILNVEPGSSATDVRAAYIKLSKLYHPDFNPGDSKSAEKFIAINNAFRKIMERLETVEDNPEEEAERKTSRGYDFTISPLGIETEPPPDPKKIVAKGLRRITIFVCAFIGAVYVNQRYMVDFKMSLKQMLYRPKSDEAKKRELRLSIIEQHKKDRNLEHRRRNMVEAVYGQRK